MKICSHCGTPQKDENFRCVECQCILPKPLPEKEEEQVNEQISDYINTHAARTDVFYVSLLDRIMIALDILGILAAVFFLWRHTVHADGGAFALMLIFLFAFGAVDTAFPRIQWFFERLRVEMRYDVTDLKPSDLYLISRKILIVAIPIIGYLGLLYLFSVVGSTADLPHKEIAEGVIVYYG